ncbi:MAG: hypothetical protein KF773_41555 [Deltaproteobacteria bacterium]|nr:hypothetical protein [Deltaproteobacteria bacterium]MCW5808977.1 hypothetical protein [Deltaproteobacteria bacterium]
MSIEAAALLFAIAGCATCAVKAGEKHRNVAAWSVLGFLFPLVGLIAITAAKSLAPPDRGDDYYDYR